jgi:hypothetical protein
VQRAIKDELFVDLFLINTLKKYDIQTLGISTTHSPYCGWYRKKKLAGSCLEGARIISCLLPAISLST